MYHNIRQHNCNRKKNVHLIVLIGFNVQNAVMQFSLFLQRCYCTVLFADHFVPFKCSKTKQTNSKRHNAFFYYQ